MNYWQKLLLATAVVQAFCGVILIYHEYEKEAERMQRESFLFYQQLINTNIIALNINKRKIYRKKRVWRKQRSNDWWERVVLQHFTEEDWLANFRMNSTTFKFICSRLKNYLHAEDRTVRDCLSVEKKVAIAIYKLASCAEYRVVANQFGTHKCIVHKCVYAFCEAVLQEFQKEYLTLPNNAEAEDIMHSFEEVCGIPNVIGVIDGIHIPILPPAVGYRDFINRKHWPSYNVMAVVDHLYRFRYATCKHPGSAHDAKVLKDSNLFLHHQRVLPTRNVNVGGQNLPCIVLGGPAYPLLPWLIKPYRGNLTLEEESFNAYMSRGRVIVENAFGRLKARFRCLLKRVDISYTFVPKIVTTCMILNNIIETRKGHFVQNWMDAVLEAEVQFPQPERYITREFDDLNGGFVRDVIKNHLSVNYPLRTSTLR